MTATNSNNSDTKASSQQSNNSNRVSSSGAAEAAVRSTSSRLPSSSSPSPTTTTTSTTTLPALKLSTAARKQSDQRALQLAGVRLRDTSRRAAAMEKERVDVAAELKQLRKRERQLDDEIGPTKAKVVVLEREVAEAKRDVVVTKVVAGLLEQVDPMGVLEEVVGRFGRALVPVQVVPVVGGERRGGGGGGGGEVVGVEAVEVGVKSEGGDGVKGVKLEQGGGGEREVTGGGAVALKANSEVADKTVKRELNGGTNEVSEVSTDDEDADVGPAGSSGAKVASS
ncbi:hypothetical protein DIS24_g529 [Lasiodiplodia hormozganensis]|uniref:Uncharacterized protein n=1 Tax=Lasiodiplodia hormozganensis TaxID=869390 RepID=A0AA39Z5Y6_9PEZI|nr:hypothetical protein DIS24_g529 [Lasiodiplodia hormozganensis]